MVVHRTYTPDRGDLVWVDLNPTRGHEQRDVRPVLVLSPRTYNKKTGLMLAVPVTSHQKGYPFEVAIEGKTIHGAILSDQPRTLDWHARRVTYIEKAPAQVLADVQARLVALVMG
jgi:mRNA interferase MazF